jgi:2-keto-4-pentenoate hydratase
MIDPASLRKLADSQWRDYQWGTPGTMFADPDTSLTLDEAYQIQMELAHLRCAAGDAVAGYKVGCIGSGVVEQFGMSGPIHARLFRSEIHRSGVTLRYRTYANPAIEGEMALRIGLDGGIAEAFPVIELHQFVFRGPRKTLVELVANNGINAGAVVPEHIEAASLDDWTRARTLSISINGLSVESGALWAVAGGAPEALEWLRSDLFRFGEVLMPGDLVLAGTRLGLHPVQTGDHVVVSIDGRDCVDCRFE